MTNPFVKKRIRNVYGKMIVIEGIDGVGKHTQSILLQEYLDSKGISSRIISYPRYESESSFFIRKFLDGGIDNDYIDNTYIKLFYAFDRLAHDKEIRKELISGKWIICDRYSYSNIAHQHAEDLVGVDKDSLAFKSNVMSYYNSMKSLEFVNLGIKSPDVVFVLNSNTEIAKKQIEKRGRKQDIIEKNDKLMKVSNDIYNTLPLCDNNIYNIECADDKKSRSVSDISKDICVHIDNIFLNKDIAKIPF